MKKTVFQRVRSNKLKSWIVIFLFFIFAGLLAAALGWYFGNIIYGYVIVLPLSIIYLFISLFSGDKVLLSTTGAKEVEKSDYPHLFHTVEGLSLAAGVPKPKCYVIEDSALNAFATGRNPENSSVAVTTGLLEKLNREELEGVLSHEISHIKNYDIRIMMLASVLLGITTLISDIFLRSMIFGGGRKSEGGGALLLLIGVALAILSPIIAQMIKLAVSRKREYIADANGAILSRNPSGLASALEKISNDPDPLVDNANKATAHLFISTPFKKSKSMISKLFSTHPPIEERIEKLKEM